jgi:acyl-CoA synthetase (AMP-forming)/AMP-acid ligase II
MIFRSRFPDVVIPDAPLHEYALANVDAFLEHPAFIEGPTGRVMTFRQLREQIRMVAAGLAQRGFAKGDRISIYSPNIPEYASTFFGTLAAGGTAVLSNPLYTAEELGRQLTDTGARIVVTVPALAPRALAALDGLGGGEVFVYGEAERCTPFARLLHDGPAPVVPIDPAQDFAAFPTSSGTTGLPKSVMLSHRAIVANVEQCAHIDPVGPGDHAIATLPFFHIYGMTVIMVALLRRGACAVTLPQFDLEHYLALTERYRAVVAYVVPPIALALAKHPLVERFDLSSIRSITSGAAPLGDELERACAERLRCLVKQGYGMTEASPVTHFTPADPALIAHGSCGLLVPNTECRIVDLEDRQDLGIGAHGELLIRGPQLMHGYLNNPDATAEALDPEGWLHTGDVGYATESGHFYIVDRLKEFIKYKGFQVAPAELEAVLLTHPSIADAAVIPCADVEAGEIPKAFVVRRAEDPALDEAAVMAYVAERVAPYKKVRRVAFTDRIPKSASGKILRRELILRERATSSA